jgi:hypothetical protein
MCDHYVRVEDGTIYGSMMGPWEHYIMRHCGRDGGTPIPISYWGNKRWIRLCHQHEDAFNGHVSALVSTEINRHEPGAQFVFDALRDWEPGDEVRHKDAQLVAEMAQVYMEGVINRTRNSFFRMMADNLTSLPELTARNWGFQVCTIEESLEVYRKNVRRLLNVDSQNMAEPVLKPVLWRKDLREVKPVGGSYVS